ncbi:hypothetical protein DP939_29825 [Spongiactinospora rosea]|uniref:Uncharacterized protein n=1 Tax=Spongiactinospora rosea TaxID=2248750 RepID=A0A366LT03_9ACTN|nr:hypothetical protein DP939_29825 [Spongiactinospora rosea]
MDHEKSPAALLKPHGARIEAAHPAQKAGDHAQFGIAVEDFAPDGYVVLGDDAQLVRWAAVRLRVRRQLGHRDLRVGDLFRVHVRVFGRLADDRPDLVSGGTEPQFLYA